jgi:hypothetical protein
LRQAVLADDKWSLGDEPAREVPEPESLGGLQRGPESDDTRSAVEADHHVGRLDDGVGVLPDFKPQLIDASLVIEAVTMRPFTSSRTCAVVTPFLTSTFALVVLKHVTPP